MPSLKTYSRYIIHGLTWLILLISIAPVSGGNTPPYSAWSGVIKKDTEWTVENGPYLIEGDLKIKKKAVLTIQPGNVIKAGGKITIFVEGSLQALGTKEAPIIFTLKRDDTVGGDINGDGGDSKPSAGDWSGIVFIKSSHNSQLSHVSVLYGGAYRGPHRWASNSPAVEVQTSGLEIDNGHFAHNLGIAIQANSKSTITPIVRSSTFLDNKGAAVRLYGYSLAASLHDNTMTGNAINGVVLGKGVLESDSVWSPKNTYVISDKIQIAEGAILLLPPGTVVKGLNKKSVIIVKATLITDGEKSLPVIFTSIKDDNYGGDTNGDQLETTPSAGDWGGIGYSSSSTNNLLLNTLVRYGGGGKNLGRLASVVTASDGLSLRGTVIEHSGSAGLYRKDSTPFVRGVDLVVTTAIPDQIIFS
ncbi:MAG: right-handed parallel beta-helix repeat-containing protein [gamma proteobacterium symbiont of Bathyaustriella thionipta]|nr:right-handed parallel beta-helix repeat-containing protein [gamma proteobacterium symbiont of Bathyaustriella thionipta]MCU7951362.1 right-handed parallel beta-helix repeat-containing protein [gamma proteobacterium symbiont of Bathyaustriella thionipta]MCU7954082.1 right-handed parallel beta-helix repeat-containing protein [gamma proteobacterium symbiont of Bathyaustriella thionipta]MCU7957912.1 right-handed parallel beta-helix repeat-containing protein [gamma proteobacterium symbiont of Bath